MINVVSYEVRLDLTQIEESDEFITHTDICFTIVGSATARFNAEFDVTDVCLNGSDATFHLRSGNMLEVPVEGSGRHYLSIRGIGAVATTRGLVRCINSRGPVIVSHFQPTGASCVFACVDEPGAKAVVTLQAAVPKGWLFATNGGISSGNEERPHSLEVPIPPYAVAVVAGANATVTEVSCGDVKARMIDFTDSPRTVLESPVLDGLVGCCELFDMEIPFINMDVCVVENTPAAGIENPGCIVLSGRLFNDSLTFHRERRGVVYHELAHLWAGDLVTVASWRELWLQEGLATWAATELLNQHYPDRDAWIDLVNWEARPAIENQILGVNDALPEGAEPKYDSTVTYLSALFLKRVEEEVGREVFIPIIREYFKAYAYRNAGVEQLAALVERTSQRAASWIRGYNATKNEDMSWRLISAADSLVGHPHPLPSLLHQRNGLVGDEMPPTCASKSLVWASAWEDVLRGRSTPVDYLESVVQAIPGEEDESLSISILLAASSILGNFCSNSTARRIWPRVSLVAWEWAQDPGRSDVARNRAVETVLRGIIDGRLARRIQVDSEASPMRYMAIQSALIANGIITPPNELSFLAPAPATRRAVWGRICDCSLPLDDRRRLLRAWFHPAYVPHIGSLAMDFFPRAEALLTVGDPIALEFVRMAYPVWSEDPAIFERSGAFETSFLHHRGQDEIQMAHQRLTKNLRVKVHSLGGAHA